MLRRLLIGPALLVLCACAFAFIEKMFSLQEVLEQSTNVMVGKLESVDAAKRVVVAKVEQPLKGKKEFGTIRMNLGIGPEPHCRYLLDRLKPGEPFVLYYQRQQQSIASLVHAGDTWYQLFATDEGKGDQTWWRLSHIEVMFGRTYNGPTADLAMLTEDVIAGKVKSPRPDAGVPRLDPEKAAKPVKPEPPKPQPQPAPAPKVEPPAPDGLEALDGWQVEASWARPAKLTVESSKRGGKVMTVASDGAADRKLALSILQHMDLSGERVLTMQVANECGRPVQLAVAFGAAPDWTMYETPASEVPAGKDVREIIFRLDAPTFKSEKSDWKHTQPMPNSGRIDKMMILVDGVPEKGIVRIEGMRFSRGDSPPSGTAAASRRP